jgi:hypothetical protein
VPPVGASRTVSCCGDLDFRESPIQGREE